MMTSSGVVDLAEINYAEEVWSTLAILRQSFN